ncbi:MAG: hypothetical protein K8I02_13800, partial [Candidatus Methylomirabilis sp.]|nr:hypothetical protein [Deltaproteobacteria bacterium]
IKAEHLYPQRVQRLIRNEPRLRYVHQEHPEHGKTGGVHQKFDHATRGRARRVDDCHIFHFHGVIHDRAKREERVRYYNSLDPTFEEVNKHFYLWEDFPHEILPCEEPLYGAAPPSGRTRQ